MRQNRTSERFYMIFWATGFCAKTQVDILMIQRHAHTHKQTLTLQMLEMEYSVFWGGVNTMHADALAPKVVRASAVMVLAV